ncbi:MAG: hypothetical protein M0C28_12190 [Candidatus Moduliflexus flocculans]|nr:hypothetical protein [Candidatus Moduliflexus flocculans]
MRIPDAAGLSDPGRRLGPLAVCRRPGEPAKGPVGRLARLYEECRYFELRDAPLLAEVEADPAPTWRSSAVARWTRPSTAWSRPSAGLRGYLEAGRSRTAARADGRSLGPPRRGLPPARAATGRPRTPTGRPSLRFGRRPRSSRSGPVSRSHVEPWSALAGVPGQRAEVASRRDGADDGSGGFPVRVAGPDRALRVRHRLQRVHPLRAQPPPSWGSSASTARLPATVTGSGYPVEGRIGRRARSWSWELRPSSGTCHLCSSCRTSSSADRDGAPWRRPERACVGMPVLEALKESRRAPGAGDPVVPARPASRPLGVEHAPVGPHAGRRGRAPRRSGSRLLRRHRGGGDLSLPAGTTGASGARSTAARGLRESVGRAASAIRGGSPSGSWTSSGFRAGGKDFALRRVLVQTQETHSDSLRFHGTIGVDLLPLCSRMTMDFASMSFV